MKQLVTHQIYSMSLYKEMTFRSSIQDGMKLHCLQVKYPRTSRVRYKMRIPELVQLQTVLALYDQELDRDRATPSYQRLKTLVRKTCGDQMIRTRNFRARNERIATVVRVKRQKGRKSAGKGEWEHVISGKQMDSVQEECLAVSATGTIVDNKHYHPLLLHRRRHRLTEEVPSKGPGPRGESPSGRKGEKACKSYLQRNCPNPSCDYWFPPVCYYYKSESGCK